MEPSEGNRASLPSLRQKQRAAADFLWSYAYLTAASLRGGGRIVVVGDSHARLFMGQPGFMALHFGPLTLHRLGRPGELLSWLHSRRRPALLVPGIRIGSQDVVLVSAGEIDVRCHIDPQMFERGRDEQEVIETLAENIAAACTEAGEALGCRTGVLQLLPPSATNPPSAGQYKIRGELSDRVRWTSRLNEAIESRLRQAGHVFAPLPDGLTNDDGSLRADASDGSVHIGSTLAPLVARSVETACRTEP